jgi:predicted DCC family thiol-disulfide oxidoreductase YuxK
MTSKLEIIYNENCPVCRFEIKHYQEYVSKRELPISFIDLNTNDLTKWEVTKDQAAKQLIAIKDGKILQGIDAFGELWKTMPRYKVLAILIKLPILNYFSRHLYNLIAAPIIYKMHKNRELKIGNTNRLS